MTSSALSNRSLANAALVGLATFPVIVIALHIVQRGHYHPLSQAVSELALGRAGWLMWIAFCGAGTGLICLGILHRRLVERSRTAPVLLAKPESSPTSRPSSTPTPKTRRRQACTTKSTRPQA